MCIEADNCDEGSPIDPGVPQPQMIDRDEKTLSTTKKAHRQRRTEVNSLMEEDGRLLLQ